MKNYQDLLTKVLIHGEERDTRSGKVYSLFGENLEFDLREGFPAVTTKKLLFNLVAGELLWFLNGRTDLPALRYYSNLPEGARTIWTDDYERWIAENPTHIPLKEGTKECLGKLYGWQWRNFEGRNYEVDQIQELINKIKYNPKSRYLVVSAWHPSDIAEEAMALGACHNMFQCYVSSDGYLDLMFNLRSSDVFLGNPYNIASYALLTHILGSFTGLTPRFLKCNLGDTHIYLNHVEAVKQQLGNVPKALPTLSMPFPKSLEDLSHLTAKDFKLEGYEHYGVIKAPLSVG